MQFVFVLTACHDASSGLEPQFIVAAYKSTDRNGLVQFPVQSDETDAASVSSAVVRLYLTDKLHGTYFRCAAQRPGRESVDESLERIRPFVQCSADAAYQMDDMAVILRLFVKQHPHVVAIAAEVVACQIYQHHMLCVLFRVGQKCFRQFFVLYGVSRTPCGSGNRIDIGLSVFYFAVCFR